MTITEIKRTEKGRYSIFIDGEFQFSIHKDIYASSEIKTGEDIDHADLEELHARSEEKLAKERALRLLTAREYTSGGLYKKLIERTDDETAAKTVEEMQSLGLIDDEDYARRYASDCVDLKGFSRSRVRRALIEKGVPREIADEVAAGLSGDHVPRIAAVIKRKYMNGLDTDKGRTKTVNALLRLGYGYGEIAVVIEHLLEDEDYYEEE